MMSQKRMQTAFFSLDELIDLVFRTLILFISGLKIIEGSITIGEYVIVNTYYSKVLAIVKYYFNLGQSYQTVKVSTERMQELLDLTVDKNGYELIDTIENIKVKDLTFSHSKDKLLLCNFYYEFKKDNVYFIAGENGRGKTTLIYILISIIKQDWGKVLYNNLNISTLDMDYLRRNAISIMLQDEYVPKITVKEFLFGEDKHVSDELAIEVLESNKVYNEFSKKILNFEKYINRNLSDLSGGERQVILITRCFLKEASLIILDEPTSNMDITSTQILLQFIEEINKNKIIVIISHDTDILKKSKNIIKL